MGDGHQWIVKTRRVGMVLVVVVVVVVAPEVPRCSWPRPPPQRGTASSGDVPTYLGNGPSGMVVPEDRSGPWQLADKIRRAVVLDRPRRQRHGQKPLGTRRPNSLVIAGRVSYLDRFVSTAQLDLHASLHPVTDVCE